MFASHLDAARSHAIGNALLAPLADVREALSADVAYLLYQSRMGGDWDIVSISCSDEKNSFLPGETVKVRQPINLHLPRATSNLKIYSKRRNFANELASTLIVPWKQADGTAWIIVGNFERSSALTHVSENTQVLDLLEVAKRSYVTGSIRGSRAIERFVKESTRRLVDAERGFDTATLLNSIASIARWLFDTSSAYVALPSTDGDKFSFVATERIKTAQFRGLSLGLDEGIGGLARRTRAPVRTTDYAQDPRLERAPMQETLREGFKSAACTPLLWDGQVNGLVYIAERDYRAFNDLDLDLLEQFASRSSEALGLDQWRKFHEDNIRRAERERLAHKLHDNVVRHLLEVGIAASMSTGITEESRLRGVLEHIHQQTQMCLDAVRDSISQSSGRRSVAVGVIAAQLQRANINSGLSRNLKFGVGCNLSSMLSAEVASALIIIGNEALSNADRHSNGRNVSIEFDRTSDDICLRIEDDGDGVLDTAFFTLLDRPGHIGLHRMRSLAQALGGTCRFKKSSAGGISVEATFPVGA